LKGQPNSLTSGLGCYGSPNGACVDDRSALQAHDDSRWPSPIRGGNLLAIKRLDGYHVYKALKERGEGKEKET